MTKGTQSDKGLEFDGIGAGPVKGSSKYAGNKTGLTAKANYGRGPVRGNDGMCHDPLNGKPVTGDSPKRPPSHVHDTHAPGAYGKAQYRGVGGTTVKKPTTIDSINYGAKRQY